MVTPDSPAISTYREILVSIEAADGLYQRILLVRPAPHQSDPSQVDELSEKRANRSLQVVGIPCKWSNDDVRSFFSRFGEVEQSFLRPAPWQGKQARKGLKRSVESPMAAHVVFKEIRALKRALKASVPLGEDKKPSSLSLPAQGSHGGLGDGNDFQGSAEGKHLTGLPKWLEEYDAARPGTAALQQMADQYILEFNKRQEQAKKELEAQAAKDDGWTLVEKKAGRRKSTDATGGTAVGAVAAAVAEKQKKKGDSRSLVPFDFYRFQHRESRRNELLELQQRFAADKKRIAQLREARKFRPY